MIKHPAPQMGTEGDVIGIRLLAYVLDSIFVGVITGVVFFIGMLIGDVGMTLAALFMFVISIVYAFLLEGIYGYTPGKYVLGLVVVKSDGSDCTIGASIIRNLLLIIDALPFAYLLGIVLILLTDNHQRVGDFAADTVVVKQQ